MSFPIRTSDGYNLLGIIGSMLFLITIGLIVFGLKKYRLRTLVIISIIYAFLPKMLIYSYQETLANGIAAVSLSENGSCHFEEASEDIMTGECSLVLKNHSSEDVTFKLEFIDSDWDGNYRAESLMNKNGPYTISIEANRQKQIDLKELLDVSEIPNRIHSGSSSYIHIKINDGEKTRIL
ncbi:hypothetical protein BSG1_04140 [Bacillus sp. SG-1]|nr:hypothetical protein BSG1_04140 [Bacillus sp. SG-1]